MRKPIHTIVVKTTASKCNLDCSYCFYLQKEWKYEQESVMRDETLDVFLKQFIDQIGNSGGIVWQGGEPTLAGTSFFKKAIDTMISYTGNRYKVVSNMLQTNGYYIPEELMDLLSEYQFLVGLSIDGPEELHNTYRKTVSGKNTWAQAMKSWQQLKARGIETNILCCITNESAQKADELYDFFKSNEMHWLQFIPVMEKNPDGTIQSYSVSSNDWGMFLSRIFDRWHADYLQGTAPHIRFIEDIAHMRLGMESPECTYMDACGTYLVLEHNGDVFSCDFLVQHKTLLGNIHRDRLIDLLNSSQQNNFGAAKQNRPEKCKQCEWLSYCYGGCPKYRDEQQHYYFCEGWKHVLNHSKDVMDIWAEMYQASNPPTKSTLDASGMF